MDQQKSFFVGDVQAVLFDMDGVVTDTAGVHASTWKRLFDEYLDERARRRGQTFRPFDPERDYHQYIDGKLRYDGVESFLGSRGINLPRGEIDDDPDRETICGLGNRENGYFDSWLKSNRVKAFPGTLAFMSRLKKAGIKIALFSSSRNAEAVLLSAGVLDWFDARVDGVDLAKLGLPGKPDPAMLVEAARRLKVSPRRSAVVEDSIAGIEAGIRGGFAVVIGVDRDRNRDALRRAGAGIVVRDLAEFAGVHG